MNKLLIIVLAVVITVSLAVIGTVVFIQSEDGKTWLVERLNNALGRDVDVSEINIDWSLTPRLTARDVIIANVEGGSAENFATFEEFSIKFEILPLIWGETRIHDLKMNAAQVNFERLDSGEANWNFGFGAVAATEEVIVPDDRSEFPVVRQLSIQDTEISYVDQRSGAAFAFDLDSINAKAPASADIRLSGEGTVRETPASIALQGGSVQDLWSNSRSFPISIQAQVGQTRFTTDGTLQQPLSMQGGTLTFQLEGQSLSDIFVIFNLPLPPSAPYALSGDLEFNGTQWTASALDGRVGDSDIGGSVEIDLGQAPTFITMELTSNKLVVADLGGLIGMTPETLAKLASDGDSETEENGKVNDREEVSADQPESDNAAPLRILPDMPVNLTRLRAANMRASLRTDSLVFPPYPTRSLNMTIKLRDGIANISPFELGFAEGSIAGQINLYGDEEIPTLHTGLTFNQIGIKDFFSKSDFFDEMGGDLDGYLTIIGQGRSLAEILSVADGQLAVQLKNGTISGLIVEAIELDIIETLAVWLGKDPALDVKCAFVGFDITKGMMQSRIFDITTQTSHIYGKGTLNLADEQLDLKIEADATDFSLLDSDAPISISGPLANPRIGVGLGAFLPLIEFGSEDKDLCGQLEQTAASLFPVYRSFRK